MNRILMKLTGMGVTLALCLMGPAAWVNAQGVEDRMLLVSDWDISEVLLGYSSVEQCQVDFFSSNHLRRRCQDGSISYVQEDSIFTGPGTCGPTSAGSVAVMIYEGLESITPVQVALLGDDMPREGSSTSEIIRRLMHLHDLGRGDPQLEWRETPIRNLADLIGTMTAVDPVAPMPVVAILSHGSEAHATTVVHVIDDDGGKCLVYHNTWGIQLATPCHIFFALVDSVIHLHGVSIVEGNWASVIEEVIWEALMTTPSGLGGAWAWEPWPLYDDMPWPPYDPLRRIPPWEPWPPYDDMPWPPEKPSDVADTYWQDEQGLKTANPTFDGNDWSGFDSAQIHQAFVEGAEETAWDKHYVLNVDDITAIGETRGLQPGTVGHENNQIIEPDYDYCGGQCRHPNANAWRPGDNLNGDLIISNAIRAVQEMEMADSTSAEGPWGDPDTYNTNPPGIGVEVTEWIVTQNESMVGSGSWPTPSGPVVPVHKEGSGIANVPTKNLGMTKTGLITGTLDGKQYMVQPPAGGVPSWDYEEQYRLHHGSMFEPGA